MTETPTNQHAVPRTTRIAFRNPAIPVVLAEGGVTQQLIERMQLVTSAIPGATPDLAISLWLRFRQLIVEAGTNLRTEGEALRRRARASSLDLDPTFVDAVIPTLPTHSDLLPAQGRFRANAFLIVAYDTASYLDRSPTAVMRAVHAATVAHHQLLLDDLNRMTREEIAVHEEAVGAVVPAGRVTIEPSTSSSVRPVIVIEH